MTAPIGEALDAASRMIGVRVGAGKGPVGLASGLAAPQGTKACVVAVGLGVCGRPLGVGVFFEGMKVGANLTVVGVQGIGVMPPAVEEIPASSAEMITIISKAKIKN